MEPTFEPWRLSDVDDLSDDHSPGWLPWWDRSPNPDVYDTFAIDMNCDDDDSDDNPKGGEILQAWWVKLETTVEEHQKKRRKGMEGKRKL
jgi:hypothetical protein